MLSIEDLPTLNASLNALSTILLLTGFFLIKTGRREGHKRVMIAAFCCSVLFLTSYLIYHAKTGSTKFEGQGAIRTVYFTILISHTFLAATVPFLAIVTFWRALRGQFEKHKKIARITFPVWLYVSITGVVIYMMLYRMNFTG